MKKLAAALLCLFAISANATETCADLIGAARTRNVEKIFYSYKDGINDLDLIDRSGYTNKLQKLSGDEIQNAINRAIVRCSKSRPSEPLSGIIQVTM